MPMGTGSQELDFSTEKVRIAVRRLLHRKTSS